jgi:hypothetical protein
MNNKEDTNQRANAMPEVRVGDRIRLRRSVDRYPNFIVKEGTGTVTEVTKYQIAAKMDAHIPNAKEWDNCIIWSADSSMPPDNWMDVFHADVEVIQ